MKSNLKIEKGLLILFSTWLLLKLHLNSSKHLYSRRYSKLQWQILNWIFLKQENWDCQSWLTSHFTDNLAQHWCCKYKVSILLEGMILSLFHSSRRRWSTFYSHGIVKTTKSKLKLIVLCLDQYQTWNWDSVLLNGVMLCMNYLSKQQVRTCCINCFNNQSVSLKRTSAETNLVRWQEI